MDETKKTCACAIAAVQLFQILDELKDELNKEDVSSWTTFDMIDNLNFHVPNVEQECNLDLNEEKVFIKDAKPDAIDQKFGDARQKIRNADFGVWKKLMQCANKI